MISVYIAFGSRSGPRIERWTRYRVQHDRNGGFGFSSNGRSLAGASVKSESPKAASKSAAGSINYMLARERTIFAYKSGEATRSEVCDAQSELMRNAVNCGVPLGERCPICHENSLVEVLYVFGPRLPAGGRCIVTNKDLERIRSWQGDFSAYDVEVCTNCKWNHLLRTNPVL